MTSCDFDNYSITYHETVRRARKAHRCCECHGMIQPGEHYHYIHGVWSEGPYSTHRCADCQHIICEIKNITKNEDICMSIGGLFEWMRDAEPSWSGEHCEFPAWDRLAGALNALAAVRGGQKIHIHARSAWPYGENTTQQKTDQQTAVVVQETAPATGAVESQTNTARGEGSDPSPAQ